MKNRIFSAAIASSLAAWLAAPAFAQNASLDQISKDLQELKNKNERLEAELEYLKQETKGQRKDAAKEAVDVENLKATASKFTWSGDFRYRNEQIKTAPNLTTDEHTQGRDRIRLRVGVNVKVNDTINGRFQISTAANNDPRSTNQTLGEGWTRKSVGIDLAYVDWRPNMQWSFQLGKMPQPWQRTASYFWDGDITPEGAAIRYTSGNLFANVFYDWLSERHSATSAAGRSDSKLFGGQLGWRQMMGSTTLTMAAGYFDVTHVQNEITSSTAIAIPSGQTGTLSTCGANAAFFGGANGNVVFDDNGASVLSGCNRLLSGFETVNALAQLDLLLGTFPMTVFADYSKNLEAETVPGLNEKLDTGYAAGVIFNRASAPKSWEAGVIWQKTEADAVFGQFHDSDFGGGRTDTEGFAIRAGYVVAPSWIVNATYFINELNNDIGAANVRDLDYKRLQLDLNYRF